MPAFTKTDFPLLRASTICPCCALDKPKGNIACWDCYRLFNMRHGFSPLVAGQIAAIEGALQSEARGYV